MTPSTSLELVVEDEFKATPITLQQYLRHPATVPLSPCNSTSQAFGVTLDVLSFDSNPEQNTVFKELPSKAANKTSSKPKTMGSACP